MEINIYEIFNKNKIKIKFWLELCRCEQSSMQGGLWIKSVVS